LRVEFTVRKQRFVRRPLTKPGILAGALHGEPSSGSIERLYHEPTESAGLRHEDLQRHD
jgi:hypothetical protein